MKLLSSSPIYRNIVVFLCRVLLPAGAIIALILIPDSVVQRPARSSNAFNWLIRVILTAYFCAAYWQLPVLSNPKGKVWFKSEWLRFLNWNENAFRIMFYFNAIGFGSGIAVLTWWALVTYVSSSAAVSLLIAVANGILFAVFLLPNYSVYRSKISE